MELLIYPSSHNRGYSAFIQIAEGGAPYGVIVPITVSEKGITFTLPADSTYEGMKFTGVFSGSELTLTDGNGEQDHLKRGKSYWQ